MTHRCSTCNCYCSVVLEFTTVPDNETVVPEGANITLNCVADGNPSPGTIRWLRNATEISNGPVLELTNVQSSDSGIYQCVAGLDKPPFSSITALTYLIVECELLCYLLCTFC